MKTVKFAEYENRKCFELMVCYYDKDTHARKDNIVIHNSLDCLPNIGMSTLAHITCTITVDTCVCVHSLYVDTGVMCFGFSTMLCTNCTHVAF